MIAQTTPAVRAQVTELLLDGITPIAAYGAVRRSLHGPSFLLESAPGAGELARHSIIGVGAMGELVARDGSVLVSTPSGTRTFSGGAVLDAARALLRQCAPAYVGGSFAPFVGAYGIAAFEFAGYFERVTYPMRSAHSPPDLHLIVPERVIIFDHYTHTATIVSLGAHQNKSQNTNADIVKVLASARIDALRPTEGVAELSAAGAPLPFTSMVDRAKAEIYAGEIFQVVLSQMWSARVGMDPFPVYRKLRSINPSPYMFYVELGDRVLLGSSPEMLCKLDGRQVRLRPLAGTRARPEAAEQERSVARGLQRDPKERAEHVMLVDLGRNDLGRVCEYGSIMVSELLAVERYSHVMHLVSEVRGILRGDADAFDLFAATFPAGTVSGAPKIRAMQLIAELEGRRRGAYGGSVVRFGFDGSLDACIVLRSADVRDGIATISAGAGIVADSIPAREDAECRAKARALAQALQARGELA